MIADDDPLTLAEACEILFRGKITPATLRAEAERGNLEIERIGRRDFVTARAIREMRVKCRSNPKAPASGSTKSDASGSSETERASIAQAALKETVKALKERSRRTSPENTSRPAKVVPFTARTS